MSIKRWALIGALCGVIASADYLVVADELRAPPASGGVVLMFPCEARLVTRIWVDGVIFYDQEIKLRECDQMEVRAPFEREVVIEWVDNFGSIRMTRVGIDGSVQSLDALIGHNRGT